MDMNIIEQKIAEELEVAVPGEPEGPYIVFTKVFPNGNRRYTYAAARAGGRGGLWYTTGPRSPKGYTWEKLYEWITEEGAQYEIKVVIGVQMIESNYPLTELV
jgi:hypothetical protein